MLIIPAIDIQDGCVVRFAQGKLDKKVYSHDPVKTARHWVRLGARCLHVVDLDGACAGTPKHIGLIKEIVATSGVPVEFGGGVRTTEAIKALLKIGVWRVILGTKAAEDKKFLERVFASFKDKIAVSIDAKDGQVCIQGWRSRTKHKLTVLEFAQRLKAVGLREVIYTDIAKDGTLRGPNIADTRRLLKSGLSVVVSGGIASLDDIRKVKTLEKKGVSGIIVGKALYEGKFTLPEALRLASPHY